MTKTDVELGKNEAAEKQEYFRETCCGMQEWHQLGRCEKSVQKTEMVTKKLIEGLNHRYRNIEESIH